VGLIIEGQAKALAPIKTGRLAGSITTQQSSGAPHGLESPATAADIPEKPQSEDEVVVGTNVEYACIFGSHTFVKCIDGNKCISIINENDKVLTQTGEYHRVLKRIEKAAKDSPNLIIVECEYRKDKTHTLITTNEHKYLVYRDGRNKWVKACELLLTDELYSMIKKAHNKNKGLMKKCLNCDIVFHPQGHSPAHKFCSNKCRFKYYAKNGNPNTGSKRTLESRNKMRILKQKHFQDNPEKHPNRILSQRGYKTDIENKIETWLIERNVSFEKQKKIGRVYVDFYLPESNEIYEGDGAFWHSNQERDIKRDAYIKSIIPDVKITHLHFFDKRFTKSINSNPIDNVYYQVCNPDPNSYVDMGIFTRKKIVSIEPLLYKKGKKNDAMKAKVYDLSIEGVHSYYANGILVSNSHIEYGTVKMDAQPFMRPAFDLAKGQTVTVLEKNGKMHLKEYLKEAK
jgi:very-short-patch-repair endonuclease